MGSRAATWAGVKLGVSLFAFCAANCAALSGRLAWLGVFLATGVFAGTGGLVRSANSLLRGSLNLLSAMKLALRESRSIGSFSKPVAAYFATAVSSGV